MHKDTLDTVVTQTGIERRAESLDIPKNDAEWGYFKTGLSLVSISGNPVVVNSVDQHGRHVEIQKRIVVKS